MSTPSLHLYGIRHHGPGCARSLRHALAQDRPDIVLIEGPPEADALIPLAADAAMRPPVALLVYALDNPGAASFYPFAEFSPEWQALRHAAEQQIPARFIDLPCAQRLAGRAAEAAAEAEAEAAAAAEAAAPDHAQAEGTGNDKASDADQDQGQAQAPVPPIHKDPLDALAQLAGYPDSDSWWEAMVEEQQHDADLFHVVLDAMRAVRQDQPPDPDPWESRREAAMRQQIRLAQKEGFQRIAVVCGAWHAPALETLPPAKHDAALLKDLPKCKVAATWVPWSNQRLARESGYGAGIASPGWYQFLWQQRANPSANGADSVDSADSRAPALSERWLTHIAHLLREQGLNASSAEVIEAVRLAKMLATLGGRSAPGLLEFNHAAASVLCMGEVAPLALIRERLIVGNLLGEVPEHTPAAPIARDLAAEQKRLRMKPEAAARELDLDLRNANDLERSQLLHRLRVIAVPWGRTQRQSGSKKGSFHEIWQLVWQPEFAINLIEAGRFGQTVASAAQNSALEAIALCTTLPQLTDWLDRCLLADLPQANQPLLTRLGDLAAQSADILHLLDALPQLAGALRYGNVRQTDRGLIAPIVEAILTRIAIGLPFAGINIGIDAARELFGRLASVNLSVSTLQDEQLTNTWRGALLQLANLLGTHPLLAGRCQRLLLDMGERDGAEVARHLGLALSDPNPETGAYWIEGFIAGSGLVLLNDERLWQILADWVAHLNPASFVAVLPLLRRAFANFSASERRMLGQRASQPSGTRAPQIQSEIDEARAAGVLPLALQLLGIAANPNPTPGAKPNAAPAPAPAATT